jgi:hypothetical protein
VITDINLRGRLTGWDVANHQAGSSNPVAAGSLTQGIDRMSEKDADAEHGNEEGD